MQQELPGSMAASVAYVGSQGRNLFLRSIANRTIGVQSNGAAAATQIREFDIVTRNADGTHRRADPAARRTRRSTTRPAAATTATTRMQLSLTRRSVKGLALNAQYTLGYSKGNTGGSNEATTAGNNARAHRATSTTTTATTTSTSATRFNLSAALHDSRQGRARRADGRSAASSTRAAACRCRCSIGRNDIVYVDAAGVVWNNAAADRTAVINTPGGGASRSTRRPDLIPGVDPFIKDGGRCS